MLRHIDGIVNNFYTYLYFFHCGRFHWFRFVFSPFSSSFFVIFHRGWQAFFCMVSIYSFKVSARHRMNVNDCSFNHGYPVKCISKLLLRLLQSILYATVATAWKQTKVVEKNVRSDKDMKKHEWTVWIDRPNQFYLSLVIFVVVYLLLFLMASLWRWNNCKIYYTMMYSSTIIMTSREEKRSQFFLFM